MTTLEAVIAGEIFFLFKKYLSESKLSKSAYFSLLQLKPSLAVSSLRQPFLQKPHKRHDACQYHIPGRY